MQMQMPEPMTPTMPPTLSGELLPGDDLSLLHVSESPGELQSEPAPMLMQADGQ